MNELERFECWAPRDGRWSEWAKPVLFAMRHISSESDAAAWRIAVEQARGRWKPPRVPDTALVLDLPGPDALALALECAAHGYRPVPLFNSCLGPNSVVPNETVRAGLELGVDALRSARLDGSAPPAFVLDARRLSGGPVPRAFDNRWRVFPQDFPSANALLARSIRSVLLVQAGQTEPRSDLAHVLLRWQKAGIAIEGLDLGAEPRSLAPTPLRVTEPAWYGWIFQRLLVTLWLRRNSAGGFGDTVPEATSSGSGFA